MSRSSVFSLCLALLCLPLTARAQASAFTYQGRLQLGSQPADGAFDFQFSLIDSATAGNRVGLPITNLVLVHNGLFAVTLDFGLSAFDGGPRWLEIAVRTNGSAEAYIVLDPRQAITATPYALSARSATLAALATNLVNGGTLLTSVPATALTGTIPLNRLSGITSAQIASATDAAYRALDTNAVQALIGQSLFTNGFPARTVRTGISPTPPMGINTWYSLGPSGATEAVVKMFADYLTTNGLASLGYRIISVDDGWTYPRGDPNARDASGNIVPDPARFPNGISATADYVHARGLKLGLYTEDTLYTSADFTGSAGHIAQDAQTFASWGVDYVKFDIYSRPDYRTPVVQFASALEQAGRPIHLYSGIYGANDPGMVALVNSLRWTGDLAPVFFNLLAHIDSASAIPWTVGPDHWIDLDVVRADFPNADQIRACFGMMAMLNAPLFLSGMINPLTHRDAFEIISNPEVIAVDQDPAAIMARCVAASGNWQLWVKPLGWAASTTRAVAVLNRSTSTPATVSIVWTNIGLPAGVATVRDLWQRATVAYATNSYTLTVPPGSAQLLKVTPGFALPFTPGRTALSDAGWLPTQINASTNIPPSGIQFYPMMRDGTVNPSTLERKPMVVRGVTYPKGLGLFANAHIDWWLGGAVDTFHAEFGVDDQAGYGASLKYQVSLDGALAYDSESMRPGDPLKVVDIPANGANVLTLEALTTQPDGYIWGDFADVVNPYFSVAAPGAGVGNSWLPVVGGQISGNLNVTNILAANLVVSSNLVFYPGQMAVDGGNLRVQNGGTAPIYAPDAIAENNTAAGRTSLYLPNWTTNSVSLVTVQWSPPDGSGPLHWTNRYQTFYYTDAGRQFDTSMDVPVTFTTNLSTIQFTNTWPDTNTLKALSLTHPSAPTNSSTKIQILKWQVRLSGTPALDLP